MTNVAVKVLELRKKWAKEPAIWSQMQWLSLYSRWPGFLFSIRATLSRTLSRVDRFLEVNFSLVNGTIISFVLVKLAGREKLLAKLKRWGGVDEKIPSSLDRLRKEILSCSSTPFFFYLLRRNFLLQVERESWIVSRALLDVPLDPSKSSFDNAGHVAN